MNRYTLYFTRSGDASHVVFTRPEDAAEYMTQFPGLAYEVRDSRGRVILTGGELAAA